jgi:hypothetical protein
MSEVMGMAILKAHAKAKNCVSKDLSVLPCPSSRNWNKALFKTSIAEIEKQFQPG